MSDAPKISRTGSKAGLATAGLGVLGRPSAAHRDAMMKGVESVEL